MTRLEQMLAFIEQDPKDSFSRYAVGLEYMSMKNYSLSVNHFEKLYELDPEYLPTYYQLGSVYAILEELVKAELIYKKGIVLAKLGDLHTCSELELALDELESKY